MDQTVSLYTPRGLTLPSSLTVCARHQNCPTFILYAPTACLPNTFHDCILAVSYKFSITWPACVNNLSWLLYNHVPITRWASASLAAGSLHVRFPSSFSVISRPRASESSALLMKISITLAGAESLPLSVTFRLSFHHRRYLPTRIKIRGDGYSFSTLRSKLKALLFSKSYSQTSFALKLNTAHHSRLTV